jgi:hypothetical protein
MFVISCWLCEVSHSFGAVYLVPAPGYSSTSTYTYYNSFLHVHTWPVLLKGAIAITPGPAGGYFFSLFIHLRNSLKETDPPPSRSIFAYAFSNSASPMSTPRTLIQA